MAFDRNLVRKLMNLTGQDQQAVVDRLEELDIDTLNELIDASVQRDDNRVYALFNTIEEGFDEATEEEIVLAPNLGDTVRVGGRDAIVKIANGPNDTVGVMIDGELEMVKKNEIEKKLDEAVMGMTSIPALRRMQELAGIKVDAKQDNEPQDQQAAQAAQQAAQAQAQAAQVQNEVQAQAQAQAQQAAQKPQQAPQQAQPQPDHTIEQPAQPVEEETPMAAIERAFGEIERCLPEVKIGDAKNIRQKLNTILQRLNESRR